MKAKHARAIRRGIMGAKIVAKGGELKIMLGTITDEMELFRWIAAGSPPKLPWLTYRAYWRRFGVRL